MKDFKEHEKERGWIETNRKTTRQNKRGRKTKREKKTEDKRRKGESDKRKGETHSDWSMLTQQTLVSEQHQQHIPGCTCLGFLLLELRWQHVREEFDGKRQQEFKPLRCGKGKKKRGNEQKKEKDGSESRLKRRWTGRKEQPLVSDKRRIRCSFSDLIVFFFLEHALLPSSPSPSR